MINRHTSIRWAIATLVAAATTAAAQTAPPKPSSGDELQEIVVTGSMIKRTDIETPSPVQVLTSDDLKNSGYTNVSDVLRNLAANGQGTLNQAFGQAFASGGAGIALRGLTVGGTLTLIDDQRMVAYPLSDDGERSFVDISAIPFNAVDHIEVLKDGASAQYGADAMAGVVNIKLRKTYVGSEITTEIGTSQHSDGTTEHLAGIAGMGDLATDGYNVWAAIDFHHTDKILPSSRSGAWTNLNWAGIPGGANNTPGAIGATGLTYPDSLTGYLVNPTAGGANAYLPGCTQALQNADKCTWNPNMPIQAPSEQTNFIAKYTKALANDWQNVITASIFDSVAQQVSAQSFGHAYQQTGQENGSNVLISFGPGLPASQVIYPVFSLPASSPLNPFGQRANLVYSFPELASLDTDVQTTTYRFMDNLKGSAGGWDMEASLGIMYARMAEKWFGLINPSEAQAALDSGAYVPGVSTNAAQLFAPEEETSNSSSLDLIDFDATRQLAQMAGGPLSIALGAQYFHKAQNDQNPAAVVQGIQEGTIAFTVGSQDDTAAFVQLESHPAEGLEIDAAGRYDHYDTYGGGFSPKFGLKYQPIKSVVVRGTWGRGFRAPSISESSPYSGIAFGQGGFNDPVLCAGGANVKGSFNSLCNYPAVGVEGGNPALKAVTATNATFGVIFEPSKLFNVSVDWYRIQLNNDIISAASNGGLANLFGTIARGPSALLPVCTATVTTGTCPQKLELTPVGYPSFADYPYLNAGITKTSGIDVDLRSQFDVGPGKVTADLNYTYIGQYEIEVTGNLYDLAGTHGPQSISGDTGNPKNRATFSLTWEQGPASVTASVNYTGSYSITDPSSGYGTCLAALNGSFPSAYGSPLAPGASTVPAGFQQFCSVAHFTDINLHAAYHVNDHLEVHAAITNLMNANPPVDLQTYGGGGELRYDAALAQDGAVGRFFLVGANYKF